MISKIVASVVSALLAPVAFAAERAMTGWVVPDGAIQIDARDTDWQQIGAPDARAGFSTDAANWLVIDAERGTYHGDNDLSFVARVASDASSLYILADVTDDFSVHTWNEQEPYYGDDFEVFIQADEPADRNKSQTANCKQWIFVPGMINPKWPEPIVWQANQNPGVKVASRLRPFGYTIEIRIPKSLLPNWKNNPDMPTIGFDLMTQDADAPGIDAHHPALKGAMFLQQVGQHFKSPEMLRGLKFEQWDGAIALMDLPPAPDVDATRIAITTIASREQADRTAQDILDLARDARIGTLLSAALESPWQAVQRAALVILAGRADLPMPTTVVAELLEPRARDAAPQQFSPPWLLEQSIKQYAMLALARRGELTFTAFDEAMFTDDPQLRLTAIYCAGINGKQAFTIKLLPMLKDKNMRIRMLTALSLGELKDPAALPALREIEQSDPSGDPRLQAKLSIEKIASAGMGR